MALQGTRFKGKVKIRGRPKEQAQAEIMIMKQKEGYENRKRRRAFFTLLDIVAILALLGGIYSFFISEYLNGTILVLIALLILGYFTLRNYLRRKQNA